MLLPFAVLSLAIAVVVVVIRFGGIRGVVHKKVRVDGARGEVFNLLLYKMNAVPCHIPPSMARRGCVCSHKMH